MTDWVKEFLLIFIMWAEAAAEHNAATHTPTASIYCCFAPVCVCGSGLGPGPGPGGFCLVRSVWSQALLWLWSNIVTVCFWTVWRPISVSTRLFLPVWSRDVWIVSVFTSCLACCLFVDLILCCRASGLQVKTPTVMVSGRHSLVPENLSWTWWLW